MQNYAVTFGKKALDKAVQKTLLELMAENYPESCSILYTIARHYDHVPNSTTFTLSNFFNPETQQPTEKFRSLFNAKEIIENGKNTLVGSGSFCEQNKIFETLNMFTIILINVHYLAQSSYCIIENGPSNLNNMNFQQKTFFNDIKILCEYTKASITAKGLDYLDTL